MAEFNSISNWLQEKCEDNNNLQKYCYHIAIKYIDFAKHEFRSLNAHEENIMLKLDIGYLQSTYRAIAENNEAQSELQSLLNEFYNEFLKFSFDIDECELEKLATYDEIKLEFEARDSMNVYQRIYDRKTKVIKCMEQRSIVRKYKEAEQEYLDAETQQLHHEENLNKLKNRLLEYERRRIEETKLILQLVEGRKELETRFANKSQPLSQIMFSCSQRFSQVTPPTVPIQKGGLSSKLLMNFKEFKISSKHSLPIIQKIDHKNGLNRLLQQSEAIRKSIQTSHITLSCEYSTPKLPGILKIPICYPKSTERSQKSQKSVSFELDLPKEVPESMDIQENSAKSSEDINSSYLGLSNDVDVEEIESLIKEEPKKQKIEIIEDVLIKAAEKSPKAESKLNQKTESPKEKLPSSGTSNGINSKSFMEMFMELSNEEVSEVESPAFEPTFDTKPPTIIPISKKPKETGSTKKVPNSKPKASLKQFDGFDDFLSQFVGQTSETIDSDQIGTAHDMSFDFFQSNDDTEVGDGDNNESFEF